MADFEINANLESNNKNFPHTPTTISFKTASAACVLNFTPSSNNCFGNVASLSLGKTDTQTLPTSGSVVAVATTFTISPASPAQTGPYDITFGNEVP